MRCHKCDEGVLQIAALTPPDEGWAIGCNRCDYSSWIPTADQMVTAQPMTAPTKIKWKIEGHYAHPSLEEHPPDCPWHKDWHACNCGLFESKEGEE